MVFNGYNINTMTTKDKQNVKDVLSTLIVVNHNKNTITTDQSLYSFLEIPEIQDILFDGYSPYTKEL